MRRSAGLPERGLRPATEAIERIRAYMRSRTCYEILPESFRLIVLNDELSILRALTALQANGAPVYGMLGV